MSFVQRELDKIAGALREPHLADKYEQLYAAQQALSWALNPSGFRAPYDEIMGILAAPEDCPASIHPRLS